MDQTSSSELGREVEDLGERSGGFRGEKWRIFRGEK
jgi:hypothetical protein